MLVLFPVAISSSAVHRRTDHARRQLLQAPGGGRTTVAKAAVLPSAGAAQQLPAKSPSPQPLLSWEGYGAYLGCFNASALMQPASTDTEAAEVLAVASATAVGANATDTASASAGNSSALPKGWPVIVRTFRPSRLDKCKGLCADAKLPMHGESTVVCGWKLCVAGIYGRSRSSWSRLRP